MAFTVVWPMWWTIASKEVEAAGRPPEWNNVCDDEESHVLFRLLSCSGSHRLDAYKLFSQRMAKVYREYGALRVIDCILDPETTDGTHFHAEGAQADVQGAELRDFNAAAATKEGETVILSWTEWPSKDARDDLLPRVLADPRVQPEDGEKAIFEGARLVAGGFAKLLDT
ncbi:DUF1428 domain-containing protein [Sinorhizobium medicae]|uniref:DUF1428 domain-containing protein n=1 Tax=Sinorhizobium medicae TaxID=110321 RepID=UPI0013E3FA6F|nr:DUF1428 family protein [Sinorhizobium medicae]